MFTRLLRRRRRPRIVPRCGDPAATKIVVWCHGGGWIGGSVDDPIDAIGPLCDTDWRVVAVDYTLGNWRRAVDDIDWAVRALTPTADRLVIAGHSAGGHLALLTGLMKRTINDGLIAFNAALLPGDMVNSVPPEDLEATQATLHAVFGTPVDPAANVAQYARAGDRIAIVAATGDPLLDEVVQAQQPTEEMTAVGADVWLTIVEAEGHYTVGVDMFPFVEGWER
jgi:acetyl esterase/lipase